jgi:DNA-binding NtrC family response regulator
MTERHPTLLIVEDEETIHKALRRTLRREPYELLHAYDAAEALAILERRSDVAGVICDHYMPGTHGLDLLRKLRRDDPDLVTVVLTAQADLQLALAAINEGQVDRFFTKPWDGARFRAELRHLVLGEDDPSGASERAHETEERLRAELLPRQDETTGAFIVDPA